MTSKVVIIYTKKYTLLSENTHFYKSYKNKDFIFELFFQIIQLVD